MAINNSSAGLAHAMDQTGPLFGIPHGLACALALPYTVAFLGPRPAYAEVARNLGGTGGDEELWRHLVGRLWQLCRDLGLPEGYRECGVTQEAFEAAVGNLAGEAAASGSTRLAPAAPDAGAFEGLFRQAFRGEPPLAG